METPNKCNRSEAPHESASTVRETWEAPKLVPLDLGNANSTQFTAKHDSDLGPKASST